MTVKERLYRLVDALPDSEAWAAARYLEFLASAADPVQWALEHAPDDDEPVTDAERRAVAESWAAYEAGDGTSLEEVKRELGLS